MIDFPKRHRVPYDADFRVADFDPDPPKGAGSEAKLEAELKESVAKLDELQRRLFADELRSFSFVIVDAPPLLDRPVGRLLLPSCDVAALVIRAGSTTRADARAATGVLHDSGVATLGAIANRVRLSPVL